MREFQPVQCEHDGVLLEGFAAVPKQVEVPYAAVLVRHSALGLGEPVRRAARRLADAGYLAIATDMYGAGADISTPEASGRLFAALIAEPERLRARTAAWFAAVAGRADVDPHRIAAIGYCFGGQCVLELARSGADLKAAGSYHGLLTTHAPAAPGSIRGEVAVFTGEKDPYAPAADVDGLRAELAAAGARHQVTVFSEAEHAFTDPDAGAISMPGISYNALADRVSWGATMALLEATLRD